jgi:hypothetical protein
MCNMNSWCYATVARCFLDFYVNDHYGRIDLWYSVDYGYGTCVLHNTVQNQVSEVRRQVNE